MSRFSPEEESAFVFDKVETVSYPSQVENLLGSVREIPDVNRRLALVAFMIQALRDEARTIHQSHQDQLINN